MKYNLKQYNSLSNDTLIETQNINNKRIEIHSLEKTSYHGTLVSKGILSKWSAGSDTEYKLLIEEGFYHEMSDYFSPTVNDKWTDTLQDILNFQRKSTLLFYVPILLIAILFLILWLSFREMFGNSGEYIAIGLLAVFLVSTMVSSRIGKKKIEEKLDDFRKSCIEAIGEQRCNELTVIQSEYYKEYIDKINAQNRALYEEKSQENIDMGTQDLDEKKEDQYVEAVEISDAIADEEEKLPQNTIDEKMIP